MWEIFTSLLSFEAAPVIGVGLIVIYFIWMISMAIMRVSKGDHIDH